MNETTMTLAGNLVEYPELRYTPSGQPVVRFRLASIPRYYDKQAGEWRDGETLFLTCQGWRQPAGRVAESPNRGTRVIVAGRLRQRSYEAKDGSGKRTVYELEADEIGVSLRNATAKVTRASRAAAGNGEQRQGDADPRASEPAGGYSDEPPFQPFSARVAPVLAEVPGAGAFVLS
jgi:single-strand DNA-binding protein